MIDNYSSPIHSSPRGAMEIERQARETEKQLAILAATYKMEHRSVAHSSDGSTNPLKKMLTAIFAGLKTPDREFRSAAQITLANQARK